MGSDPTFYVFFVVAILLMFVKNFKVLFKT